MARLLMDSDFVNQTESTSSVDSDMIIISSSGSIGSIRTIKLSNVSTLAGGLNNQILFNNNGLSDGSNLYVSGSDIEFVNPGAGIILTSVSSSRYRITVTNAGIPEVQDASTNEVTYSPQTEIDQLFHNILLGI